MTKIDKVQTHLKSKGSITSWEAITLYRYTRLSDAILRLRRKGMNIVSVPKKNKNTRYVEYKLIENGNH